MSFIDDATSTEWPSGRSDLVVKALFTLYAPQDIMSQTKMKRELNKVSMKKNSLVFLCLFILSLVGQFNENTVFSEKFLF